MREKRTRKSTTRKTEGAKEKLKRQTDQYVGGLKK